jgi:hypothetical protein
MQGWRVRNRRFREWCCDAVERHSELRIPGEVTRSKVAVVLEDVRQ